MDFNITMDDLPLVERDRVLTLYAACKRIREASACYGGQQEAIRDAAALCGISPVTMRRWYDIWRNNGDNPLSLVDRRYRKIQARSRVTLSKFLAYWHGLCTRCQRNGGIPTARQLLLKTWTERRDTIPGYEDWPGCRASPPAGACAICRGSLPNLWRRWRSSRASGPPRPSWRRYWPPAKGSGWAVISSLTTSGLT